MAQKKRIYVVVDTATKVESLVRAAGKAQAIGHVVRERFTADVADQAALVRLVGAKVEVQDAGDE